MFAGDQVRLLQSPIRDCHPFVTPDSLEHYASVISVERLLFITALLLSTAFSNSYVDIHFRNRNVAITADIFFLSFILKPYHLTGLEVVKAQPV